MPQSLFDIDHLTSYQYKHPRLMQRFAQEPADSVAICPINIEEIMRGRFATLARVLTASDDKGEHRASHAFASVAKETSWPVPTGRAVTTRWVEFTPAPSP